MCPFELNDCTARFENFGWAGSVGAKDVVTVLLYVGLMS